MLAALTAALITAGTVTASAALAGEPQGGAGAVFVQTNDISARLCPLRRRRAHTGRPLPDARSRGHGARRADRPLSSQGSLTVDRRHRLLYAVNPGSDTVSVVRS
jgi:hypothetical protein